MTDEHRYQLSDRIELAFTSRPDATCRDVWIIERPGPDGSGGQVHLTTQEWDWLVGRIPHLQDLTG